jgi:hypothetical protein
MWGAIAQLGIGAIQTGISAAKASQLPDPKEHSMGRDLSLAVQMSRRRADEGYSPEEKSAFEQMMGRRTTGTKRMFQNAGLSGIGSAASNIMGGDALNKFAADGASIKRQNFGQFANLAGQADQVQQMETSRFNEQLRTEETALGGATQAGIGNMFGGLGAADTFAQNEKAIDSYNNMGQGGGNKNNGNGQNIGFGNNNSSFGQRPNNPNMYGFNPSFKPDGTWYPNMQQTQTAPQNNFNPNQFNPNGMGNGPGLFGQFGY